MKNTQLNRQRIQLIRLIKKWKVSQPVLAAAIEMPATTFKNKLHETGGKYQFSDEEFLKLATIIDRMQNEFAAFCTALDDADDIVI